MSFNINCNEKLHECETWSFPKGSILRVSEENLLSQDRGSCTSESEESGEYYIMRSFTDVTQMKALSPGGLEI
jgi:hypothetical protein